MRKQALVFSLLLVTALSPLRNVHAQQGDSEAPHVRLTPDAIKWQPFPREWTDGPPPEEFRNQVATTEVAIIQGDRIRKIRLS